MFFYAIISEQCQQNPGEIKLLTYFARDCIISKSLNHLKKRREWWKMSGTRFQCAHCGCKAPFQIDSWPNFGCCGIFINDSIRNHSILRSNDDDFQSRKNKSNILRWHIWPVSRKRIQNALLFKTENQTMAGKKRRIVIEYFHWPSHSLELNEIDVCCYASMFRCSKQESNWP